MFESSWEKRINRKVATLTDRIREQAKKAGISVPKAYLSGIPKEFTKFGYFEPLLDIMIKTDPSTVMTKQRSFEQYADHMAKSLGWKRKKGHPGRLKQSSLFRIVQEPMWTPLAQNFPIEHLRDELQRLQKVVYNHSGWGDAGLKDTIAPVVENMGALGIINGAFIMGHAATLSGQMDMPWSPRDNQTGDRQVLPLPLHFYEDTYEEVREVLLKTGEYMNPSHMLVGSPSAGGRYDQRQGVIQQGNPSGAAGYPYTGEKDARSLTSDQQRATKGNTAQRELQALIDHVIAGQPWQGETWDRIHQPTTMTARGDAKVSVDLLIFSNALLKAGYPLAKLLTASRGIAICPNIAGQMESIVAGPFLEKLNSNNVLEYDLRHGRLVKTTVLNFFDLLSHLYVIVSGDVARWDLNGFSGEHGLMAASWANLLPPGELPLLFGAATGPALWSPQQVENLMNRIPVGKYEKVEVVVPNKEGDGSHTETVKVHHLLVDCRKMIVQAFSVVHGAGISMWDYELPTTVQRVAIPDSIMSFGDKEPEDKGWYIDVHGGIRSGSLLTSANNSKLNHHITRAGTAAVQTLGARSKLVTKRAASVGYTVGKVTGDRRRDKHFLRGDDSLWATTMKIQNKEGIELNPAEVFSVIMAMVGRYGNAAKQVVGTAQDPRLEFASVNYGKESPGGNTKLQRSFERGITMEGGNPTNELRPMENAEKELDLGLVSSTLSAKARLMPQRGSSKPTSPFGSPTPGNEEIVRAFADMDLYGLVYNSIEDPEMMAAFIAAEARRYASREGRKHGMDTDNLKILEQEYLEAELHSLLAQFARDRDGKAHPARKPDGASISFDEAVAGAGKGEYTYLF